MRRKLLPLICGVSILVAGCGIMDSTPKRGTAREPGFFEASMRFRPRVRDEAEIQISEAADSVSESLKQLAEIERAVHPNAKLPTPPSARQVGMQGIASVDWIGPVKPLVDRIAQASHYRVRVVGNAPPVPVLVHVTKQDVPLLDILRDVTYQAHKKADIVLYPKRRVIELRYKA